MKTTKTHIFVFIIVCATIGTHMPIVALFIIYVSIVALALRRWQKNSSKPYFYKT